MSYPEMTADEVAAEYAAELSAALALGFLAADFVRQPETMPVFKEWVATVAPANPHLADFAELLDSEAASHLCEVLMDLMLGVKP